jgi:hypothetical protein
MQMKRLYTTDTKAINHVLMNDNIYQKPESVRYNLNLIMGSGVLVVEGDKHKQQVNLPTHPILETKFKRKPFSVESWYNDYLNNLQPCS